MKRKAINVKYRKSSDSFPDYLKYEVTVLNEDGTTEVIPAYGKDLQDALSRVVHDEKVKKITNKTRKISIYGWMGAWFGYLGALSVWFQKSEHPMILVGGLGFAIVAFVFVAIYLKERNIKK
jgi:hypothetical protein